jgi:hypothetical protein
MFRLSHLLLFNLSVSRLGGVMVSVLTTGSRGREFKAGQDDGFLRALKIRSTPFFGWEVKPEAPCREMLRHVKITCVK